MKIKALASIVLLVLVSITLRAQLPDSVSQKIDKLFVEWNAPNHPGGSIAVMKEDKVVYSKAFGLASLEYLVPNSTSTVFNIASVSKQFTALGIVLLEEQGKLSFDDDILKHIPELPDFGEEITIRHLLHHTSGLRSLHALLELAGWRGDDTRTNADLNRFMLKQKDLNFKPGDEYLYCNTGYMLMVNIIENITDQQFTSWMKANIFDRLGMPNTYVEDKYNRVVANNATSYYGRTEFMRAVEYWGYTGSGNIHSNTDDLLRWLSNFSAAQKGWESAFAKLQTLDPFNDGTPNSYAFGVDIDTHLGKKRISHGGAIGGFRSFAAAYPEENVSIVVLTNFSGGNPQGNANKITKMLIREPAVEKSNDSKIKSIAVSGESLKKFEGMYWNSRQKIARKIYVKNDTLTYHRSAQRESSLIPISDNTFRMPYPTGDLIVRFEQNKGTDQFSISAEGQSTGYFEKVEIMEPTTAELSEYVGTYYSPEVESSFTLSLKGDALSFYHPRHGDINMKHSHKDVFIGDWPLVVVEVHRDEMHKVDGLLISNGRVRNMWFGKEES